MFGLISKPFILILFFLSFNLFSQTREGSINLGGDKRSVIFNLGGGNIGIEDNAFTIEGWVYLLENNDNDFNFFKLENRGVQISLSYRGDGDKNSSSAWVVESDNLPEANKDKKNWQLGYSSSFSAPNFLNTWRHVAFTVNKGSNIKLYIDGQLAISETLKTNNKTLSSLYPTGDGSNDANAISRFGGGAHNSDVSGKMYLGDLRIWATEISSTNIGLYYDEEINQSHPNWLSLKRYYTGTEISGEDSDKRLPDRSSAGFNAYPSNLDVGINADDSPKIKPPSFSATNIDAYLETVNCKVGFVNTYWTDFNTDDATKRYINANSVGYELKRENLIVYNGDGTSASYKDESVIPGTKYTYTLRTFWFIDGVRYYSDNVETNSEDGYAKEEFDFPSNISATQNRCDGAIQVTWNNPASVPQNWYIERGNSPSFDTLITETIDGTNTSFLRENEFFLEKDIYFRITPHGKDANNCEIGENFSASITGKTSLPPVAPVNVNINPNISSGTLDISWENQEANNADSWIIKRTLEDNSGEVEFTQGVTSTSFTDNGLQLCQTYKYIVGSVNECATAGVFSPESVSGNISVDLTDAITALEGSKGYFSDGVRLEWDVNVNLSSIDRFRIYRTRTDDINYQLIGIVENNLTFLDETALPGIFYSYSVSGEALCNGDIISTNEKTDLGFVLPFGVANGHVEYDGGNAVKDVTLTFENGEDVSGKSAYFDGNGHVATQLVYSLGKFEGVTAEAWINTTYHAGYIIDAGGRAFFGLQISEGMPRLIMTNNDDFFVEGSEAVNDGKWHHIAGAYDGTYSSLYVDGELVDSVYLPWGFGRFNASDVYCTVGAQTNHNFIYGEDFGNRFRGLMDEVRVWDHGRTADEIKRDYNRVMNGEQDGLLLYYRFDEGIGNHTYDVSKDNEVFNKMDGEFFNGITFSDDSPSSSLLGIKATTNEFGDYTVDYIPYLSGGDIFKVTPAFGQHAFQPSSRTVFIGDGAQTQNRLDFTDISFFTVTGKVTYDGTNVPVEGTSILIDGEQAIGLGNQPVRTDSDGNYEINVPIGLHHLSTEKDGHVYSEGFFPPKNEYGDIQQHEFVEDIIVNFTDSTTVKVTGRVVGGDVQGNKQIGFDKSLNNVGTATLSFDLQNDAYNLPTASVTTDPYSGEYSIELIPESFLINDIVTEAQYTKSKTELPILDLSNSLSTLVEIDTVYNYTISPTGDTTAVTIDEIRSFTYNHLANFIFKAAPSVDVFETNKDGLIGDTAVVFIDQNTALEDTLFLTPNSPFDYPVFKFGNDYDVNIYVNEKYNNPFHPDGEVNDEVPLQNVEVVINNQLMVNPTGITGNTNSEGIYLHEFKAGIPNVSENGETSYTKIVEINVEVDGSSFAWEPGLEGIYRAYVLGAFPIEGSDFITYGPEVPEIVLHDPPGSNSYAFIEKGSSYNMSQKWNYDLNTEGALDYTKYSGIRYGVGGGLAGPFTETEFILDNTYGLELTKEFNSSGQYTESVTFTERIETSSDPEDVGSDADLYVGKAYNMFMTKSKNFKPMTKGYADDNGLSYVGPNAIERDDIVLGLIDGFVTDNSEVETYFIYSQKQIMSEILPNLMVLRDNLFLRPEYESNLPVTHRHYGMDNDHSSVVEFRQDSLIANPAAVLTDISYTFTPSYDGQIDSVTVLNQQMGIWLNTIALNEAEKVEAETIRNISIDGSSGAFSSSIKQEFTSEFNYQRVNRMKYYSDAQAGVTYSGQGYSINSVFDLSAEVASTDGEVRKNSVEFGYVIDERDEGDYYSIDVKFDQGAKFTSIDNFTKRVKTSDEWWKDQGSLATFGGSIGGAKSVAGYAVSKLVTGMASKTSSRSNAILNAALFTADVAFQVYDFVDLSMYRENVHTDMDKNGVLDVTDFAISSPIFFVRGGQTRCPYEGEEKTSFYIEEGTDEFISLNAATLQRELPVLNVEPSIRADVPESETAKFTLNLQNESESNSDMLYEIQVLEETNPDGAILLIDGLTAERGFLVPAFETVTKTLTVGKSVGSVMDYDSIGIILKSSCQFDPTNLQANIADTVYLSVSFLPECTPVDIKGGQDNWVINYADNNTETVTLEGYDINQANLDRVDFQYKTLSGTPVTTMSLFKDTATTEYQNYTGMKDELVGGESTFIWDVKNLNDRQYQIRAVSYCADGSTSESDYYQGTIDRVTPEVFGKPQPSDGILDASDDIKIRFNEEIESGLVKDFNFSVRSILNGTSISHGTSVKFNGVNEYARISAVSFNNKSFTIEFWLERAIGSAGTVFSKGLGDDQTEIQFATDGSMTINIGGTNYAANPLPLYNTVTPEDAWQHWALSYDRELKEFILILNDKAVLIEQNVEFSPAQVEDVNLARSISGSSYLTCNIHEVRIWETALSVSQSVENMNATLTGEEVNLYGYWPLDDATGVLAIDKAAGRHMTVNGIWEIAPGSNAFAFNGTDQYLTLDGKNVVISEETDFTIEFWFRTSASSETQTLFSSGKGDLTDVLNQEFALSINTNSNGGIDVVSLGNTFNAVTQNFFDDQWHHFALVVERQSNVRSYIDGNLQKTTGSSSISALAGTNLWLGARGYKLNPIDVWVDQFFNGDIDEFRIWNSARTVEYIGLYKNSKLNGDEYGLLSYLPFEEYNDVLGTIIRGTTLSDEATPLFLTQANPASANSADSFTEGAAIKDVRPTQDIPFDFVVNGDEIVITPLIDANRIEGQTLEISVSEIKDLFGNTQLSTVSWTAFVQQNELVWKESTIEVNHTLGKSSSFTATIVNLGGTIYDYDLENLPAWLNSSDVFGSVEPNSEKEVVFTINEGLNVGYYEQSINLSTILDFDEKLTIKVSAVKEAPEWVFDANDYQFSMNVFGQVIIKDIISVDKNDQVAAFVGDELRGVANVEYVESLDAFLVFLNVYSNSSSGDDVELRVWDASEGTLHEEVTPDLIFLANSIIGTSTNPQEIIASDAITSTMNLEPGWTWVSFNLGSSDLSVVDSIFDGVGIARDQVKGQDAFDAYDPLTGWLGNLTISGGLDEREMYKVFLAEGGTVKYIGEPVDPNTTSIDLVEGWNYVGFTPQASLTIDEALVGMNPQTGDVIKSQTQFAMYDELFGWVGSLSTLAPNKGYMISSTANTSFIYPENSSLSSLRLDQSTSIELPEEYLINENQFSENMSIIATLDDKSDYVPNGNEVLLAFVGSESRGYASPITLSNGDISYFLTVYGKASEGLNFSFYDNGELIPADNLLSYQSNKVIGDLSNPYILRVSEFVQNGLTISPNPFDEELSLQLNCEKGTVELFNVSGRLIESKTIDSEKTIIRNANLPSGVYTLKVTSACGTFVEQVIKQ